MSVLHPILRSQDGAKILTAELIILVVGGTYTVDVGVLGDYAYSRIRT